LSSAENRPACFFSLDRQVDVKSSPSIVRFVDLESQHTALERELTAAFGSVLRSGRFILGPEVEAFEREFSQAFDVRHAIGMSSGTDALLAALMAANIQPGDEVITTSYSFFATAGCIARLGATPVFVDVQSDTLNIDPAQIAARVTPRTRAIVPVHLFGLPADLDEILKVARRHDLVVIEDACQAIGARYRDQPVGAIGHMAAFSFFPTKNLGGLGEGGMLTTQSDDVAERVRQLRAHGSRTRYIHEFVGGNFRMDALQAALLRVKLPHAAAWTAARRANATRYRQLFTAAALTDVRLPPELTDRSHVFHQYVIHTPRRDELRSWLAARGIETEVYYPVPLHLQPCFAALSYRTGDLPRAERGAETALALPAYPELRAEQQDAVVAAIAEFHGSPDRSKS
jgi:dTDP-4-amino-4,6-dideoxygalactose transaminase